MVGVEELDGGCGIELDGGCGLELDGGCGVELDGRVWNRVRWKSVE